MSSSRIRRVMATSTLSVALVAGAVVAPTAGAVSTTIKDEKCTITLTDDESDKLSNAESKANDVDSSLIKDELKIWPKDASKRARDVEKHAEELYNDLAGFEADAAIDEGESAQRAKNNIKVAEAFRDIAPDYAKALDACAKKEEFKKDEVKGDNTSSNIDKGGAILFGVAGGLTAILVAIYTAAPFLKTVLPPELAAMLPA